MSAPGVTDYAAFLPPARQRQVGAPPQSSWWSWRGHEVHVLRRTATDAPVRVLLVHGAGAHSAALWPLAALLPAGQVDLTAVDLPLYGRTVSPDTAGVRYGDWVELLRDLVAAEDDGRPLVLLGASVGGLLAHEVAATSRHVAAVVATCLLDPGDWRARAAMTRFGPLGALGRPLARLLPAGLARRSVPMSRVAALRRMSRNRDLARLCAADPHGGGASVPLGFLTSYLGYRHTPPEQMSTPVVLAHPARDAWTPVELSTRWLARVAAPARLVVLRECGHFPVEEPGLQDLVDVVLEVTGEVRRSAR